MSMLVGMPGGTMIVEGAGTAMLTDGRLPGWRESTTRCAPARAAVKNWVVLPPVSAETSVGEQRKPIEVSALAKASSTLLTTPLQDEPQGTSVVISFLPALSAAS